MVTDGDLRRHMDDLFMQKKAGAVMTANPVTLSPDFWQKKLFCG